MSRRIPGVLTVRYAQVRKQPVTTNTDIEEALGLTPLIVDCCEKGFRVRKDSKAALKALMITIDWARVKEVDKKFVVKDGADEMIISETPLLWISQERFDRLMRNCFKVVLPEIFKKEMRLARRSARRRMSRFQSLRNGVA
jgi:hypothetical protein